MVRPASESPRSAARFLLAALLSVGASTACAEVGRLNVGGGEEVETETETSSDPLPQCSPLVQDCANGEACYPVGQTFECAPTSENAQGFGEPCGLSTDCGIGLMCGPEISAGCADGFGCCTYLCEVAEANACGAGLECRSLFEPPPGFEDVGACVPTTTPG